MRVFVAEGNAPVRARLAALVQEQPGCELVGMAPGLDALVEQLRVGRPRLLILGHRLADASGFEALRQTAGAVSGMITILLCDHLDGQYLFNARALGADYVLESPRDIDILVGLVRQLAKVRPSSVKRTSDSDDDEET